MARKARAAIDASLPALSPGDDAAILGDGGFRDVALFYAAFTWRGWIARAQGTTLDAGRRPLLLRAL